MKKFLAILLALALLMSFSACSENKNDKKPENSKPTNSQTDFVKPNNYATVIKITINPKFNLYLDKNNAVLAIEPLNDDAVTVCKNFTPSKTDLETVINEVLSAVNDANFVKENAEIKVAIAEIKDETVNTEALLQNTKTAIEKKATELKITVKVETNTQNPEDTNLQKPNEDTTSKPEAKKIIYRLFMTDTFNNDGSIHFDVLARDCIQFFNDEKYLVSEENEGIILNFEIPEKVIYDRIVKKYVFSDADWKAFKEKGSYDLNGPETATYENGIFKYRRVDAWGGGEPITYKILEHIDNKDGTLKITYQVTPAETTPYMVQIGYQYDKKYVNTTYEIINPNDEYYVGAITSTDKSFIDSLKIASIIKL